MSSLNTREMEKREAAKAQIDRNLESEGIPAKFREFDVLETRLYPIDTYSTKFMSAKDQVTLAVDKIDTPEIRLTLSPVPTHPRFYLDPQVKIYDYESRLSLNDGDEDAFAVLADSFANGQMHKFTMEGSGSYMIAYAKDTIDGTLFLFDLYQDASAGAPAISAILSMTAPDIGSPYTDGMVWEYLVTMHERENEKPKDSAIKAAYNELKEFMRSAIVSLGVLPSKI